MHQYRSSRGAVIAWRQGASYAAAPVDPGSGVARPRRNWYIVSRRQPVVWFSRGDAGAGPAPSTPTVTVTLVDRSNNLQTAQTGIYWALLDSLPPSATILAQGSGESSDGTGQVSIDVTASGLTAGATAWLVITDGQAAPNTKGRIVPVTVS